MKSVVIHKVGGPDVLELVEEDVPVPGMGHVLIRTNAMAVSGPDVLIRKGAYAWGPSLPCNPGNELAGVIEALGDGVQDLERGQLVLLSSRELPVRGGCYTQFRSVPATTVHVLPAHVDPEQAVVLPSYVVAHAMLTNVWKPNMRSVFVNGSAGTIGGALAELAKLRGLTVIGSVGSDEKAAFARSRGVDHVINHRRESLLETVMDITSGRGVDAAFDHIIGDRFLECIRMLGDFGTAVAYNVYTPMPHEDVFGEMRRLSKRSPGLRVFNIHTFDHDLPALRKLTRELIDMLAAGTLHPPIGARLDLRDISEAHRLFEAGQTLGKIIVLP